MRAELVRQVARMQGDLLRSHRIGHHQWYAEMLVASAFDGAIAETNNPNVDVLTTRWGRVQVKSQVERTVRKIA